MNNSLIYMAMTLSSRGSFDINYDELSKEEKDIFSFMDECMFGDNKRLNDASLYVIMIITKLMDKPDAFSPEDVQIMKDEIYRDLNSVEKQTMDKFTLACINSIGVCSKKRENERKLIKRRDE